LLSQGTRSQEKEVDVTVNRGGKVEGGEENFFNAFVGRKKGGVGGRGCAIDVEKDRNRGWK